MPFWKICFVSENEKKYKAPARKQLSLAVRLKSEAVSLALCTGVKNVIFMSFTGEGYSIFVPFVRSQLDPFFSQSLCYAKVTASYSAYRRVSGIGLLI